MQDIPFHIAFLLTQHECVIVPGLGAFIVTSSERAIISRWGFFLPPERTLDFDSEINDDDGLLVNAIIEKEKISREKAQFFIYQFVTSTLQSLEEGDELHVRGVGTLYMKDHKQLFRADKTLSCNANYFGLNRFSLPFLKDLPKQENMPKPVKVFQEDSNDENELIPVRRKSPLYFSLVVLVIIALCIIIPFPLNNDRFSPESKNQSYSMQDSINEEDSVPENEIQLPADLSLANSENGNAKATSLVRVTSLDYYIVIANFPDESSAKKKLSEVQAKGFDKAAILSTDEKYRVYITHFEKKADAERYLTQFRIDYSEYSNAWLLSSSPPHRSE